MHITDASSGGPEPGSEPCRFPKLEECAHFHYERVQLPRLSVTIQTNMDQSLHSQHSHDDGEWHMLQVTSGRECWLLQRNLENFRMLDSQLHQCIYDRKISLLPDLSSPAAMSRLQEASDDEGVVERALAAYLERFCEIADNSINCGPVLNWLQMDNKGHRLLVPSEESRSINTPAVAAAYSVRRYVSQARDELNLEVGDMISVIDMASPGESIWWRGKRGFQVGFFPQHCVHIIGDKVPRNMPLPAPVVGSLALSPIKPVLRKHGKLIAFFRSFILNRPSRRRLKQSGILKERVFGCDLGEHLLNSGHDIPMVLKCCAEFIETRGIVDGIYRLSGVTTNIQKLRNAFDEDRIPDLYTEDILKDIHSVPSLLKMYFRELPNPLCTYQLYQSFVTAVQGCNTSLRNSETDHERLLKMREAVQKLPPPHYRTLEYLMRHLARVAKHGDVTSMTTRNVAIVWAPNLLRCAELEVGGAAALQGVGVQAVVTEFLICYADLIFCDNLPNLDRPSIMIDAAASSPKRSRPKSLAISTPTKLITLEEARSKHLLNKDCGYIEVGGGPDNLPKKYHTIIELPHGARKRGLAKRSPSGGWRSFFTKSRNASQGALSKSRKASTPGIVIAEKAVTESDLKRKLRSVKSAESLTSGHSEPATNDIDILGPLHCLNKPPGHNRSVSHDSYFDTLQSSHNNSEGSLLDLSEIQLNFELEESEMRIFSEDESLVSSPRIQKDANQRRLLSRPRHDDFLSANNSTNPSPKKQPRVVLSPESMSRKRTRLEDQLSDIQFIDCNTPDNGNPCTLATTAVVHNEKPDECMTDSYQPRNKSPRNSEIPDLRLEKAKRQSLNLEGNSNNNTVSIPKSLTEVDIGQKLEVQSTTSTPLSPLYKPLVDSSSNTTPGDYSPSTDVIYQKLNKSPGDLKVKTFDLLSSPTKKSAPKSPTYENVLTTISITYKSPTKSVKTPPSSESVYEDIEIRTENAQIPTSTANLPVQQAKNNDIRPKSFNDIETLRKTPPTKTETEIDALFANLKSTIDNNSLTDLSLSEVLNSSSEYLHSNRTSVSLPLTPTRGTLSPNVSPTEAPDTLSQDLLTPTSLSMSKNASLNASKDSLKSVSTPLDKTSESPLVLNDEDSEIDSFPKCDTTLSELYDTYDQLARQNSGNWEDVHYENVAENEEITVDGKKCDMYNDTTYENVEFCNSKQQQIGLQNKQQSLENIRMKSFENIEMKNQTQIMKNAGFMKNPNNSERNEFTDKNKMSNDVPFGSKIDIVENVDIKPNTLEKIEFGKNPNINENVNITNSSNFRNNSNIENSTFQINQNVSNTSRMKSNVSDESSFRVQPNVSENVGSKGNQNCRNNSNNIEDVDFRNNPNILGNVEFRNKPNVLEIISDRPKSINLIEFSPLVENVNEKRKQTETEATDSAIYQQVKYFRRSVHEINSLLDLEKNTEQVVPDASQMNVEMSNADNFDSLENDNTHIYENCEPNVYENIDFSSDSLETTKNEDSNEKVNVKNLTSKFETKEEKPKLPNFDIDEQAQIRRSKKFKDGLPPCLRARNLKNAIKTRSLDEEEFRREFETHNHSRRKSLDENINYNINTLPKSLNKPKILPGEDPDMRVVHLAHSIESVNENPSITTSNQNLNRERIEKYKEERRKFLHDKYRSESFKEDKDVLLSRFKVFKPKEEEELSKCKTKEGEDLLKTKEYEERIKTIPVDNIDIINYIQTRYKDERDVQSRLKDDNLRIKEERDVLQSRLRNDKELLQSRFKEDKSLHDDKDILQSRLRNEKDARQKDIRKDEKESRIKNERDTPEKFRDDKDFLHSRYKDDRDILQSRFKDDKDIIQARFKDDKDILHLKFKDEKDKNVLLLQSRLDKDISQSRNKLFKSKDEELHFYRNPNSSESLRADDDVLSRSPKRSSIRSKTAIFEGAGVKKEAEDGVELRSRSRREAVTSERQRHTLENREREPESVDSASRRVSLDPKPLRREKTSPSYCIKDMKAIFESKSHQ